MAAKNLTTKFNSFNKSCQDWHSNSAGWSFGSVHLFALAEWADKIDQYLIYVLTTYLPSFFKDNCIKDIIKMLLAQGLTVKKMRAVLKETK